MLDLGSLGRFRQISDALHKPSYAVKFINNRINTNRGREGLAQQFRVQDIGVIRVSSGEGITRWIFATKHKHSFFKGKRP